MDTFDCPKDHPDHRLFVDLQRLEQQFNQAWEVAMMAPETASVLGLWHSIEPFLTHLSDAEQLRLAAFVIAQLSELYTLKADRLLGDWQDQHNDEGPLMEIDLLQGLVQQSMYLDLKDLVRSKIKAARSSSGQSVAGSVEKKKVLQMIEAIESEETVKQQALQVAHDESVSTWIEIIGQWLQQSEQATSLPELVRAVDLPLVKVWLALLLGNYVLESRGEFYDANQIWIQGKF